jgi:hypothetical protein
MHRDLHLPTPSPAVQSTSSRLPIVSPPTFGFERWAIRDRWKEAWTRPTPARSPFPRRSRHAFLLNCYPSNPCLSNFQAAGPCRYLHNVYENKMGALARTMSQSSLNEAFVASRACMPCSSVLLPLVVSRLRKRANSVAPAFPPQPLLIPH